MKCEFCNHRAHHAIRETQLCSPHYIEALEHCANWNLDLMFARFTALELEDKLIAEAELTRRTLNFRARRFNNPTPPLSAEQLDFIKGAA